MIKEVKAFLIHKRAYKGNSLLLDFLSLDLGMIRCIANGIRASKYGAVQPFCKLDITIRGNRELKTLTNFEINDKPRAFTGDKLLIVMYINELLARLLLPLEIHTNLFYLYADFVDKLAEIDTNNKQKQHWLLRLFEKNLLSELGYELNYKLDIKNNIIETNKYYTYCQNQGFLVNKNGDISGELLIFLQLNKYDAVVDKLQLRVCRDLFRAQLNLLLGNKPLQSRILLQKLKT